MNKKKLAAMLAFGLTVGQFGKLTLSQEPKIFVEDQTKFVKIQPINQNNSPKFYQGCELKKDLAENGLDKSICSGCIYAGNCSGCAFSASDNSNGWISLDDLPQLTSITTEISK